MLKNIARFGLAVGIAASPTVALAQTGTSSSWGLLRFRPDYSDAGADALRPRLERRP